MIGYGIRGVWAYSSKPGESARAPSDWPKDTRLVLHPDRFTLLVFMHPHCPCSRASKAELDRVIARCADRVKVRVVFVKPSGASNDWEQTELWKQVGQATGVERILDEEAREAGLFGAATSGQALLYSPSGQLLFRGGITGARGEEGDNAGRNSIVDLINNRAGLGQTPVFGCPLTRTSELQTQEPECRP